MRAVARGETYVQPSAARTLAGGISRRGAPPTERDRYERITERERDVLELIADGLSNTEISRRLFLSEKTVRNRVSDVFTKLGVASRAEAVARARDAGLGSGGS